MWSFLYQILATWKELYDKCDKSDQSDKVCMCSPVMDVTRSDYWGLRVLDWN